MTVPYGLKLIVCFQSRLFRRKHLLPQGGGATITSLKLPCKGSFTPLKI